MTNAVRGLWSNFKIGLKIRLAVTIIQILLRGGKLKNIKIADQLRFPTFLAAFAFVAKLVLCTLRRIRGTDDGMNGFVSGFLAGVTLLINNDEGTKKMFALYLLSRAYGASFNVMDERGYVPHILGDQQHMIFILATQAIFVWLYFCEFSTTPIPQSFYAAVNHFYSSHKDKNDHIMRDVLQKRLEYFKPAAGVAANVVGKALKLKK